MPDDRRDWVTLAECLRLTREHYSVRWDEKTRPYEVISALLDALTKRGIRMAVFSNKPDEFTQLCVDRLLTGWHFEVVLGAAASLPKKPDPAGALLIAERLQLDPADILYLGDTATDMQTAVAAGMFPVGALWGFRTAEELAAHGAQTLIPQPLDLLRFFDAVPPR